MVVKEDQKKTPLQDSVEQCRLLLRLSWKLEGIADAFRVTGNEPLALQLENIAREVYTAQEQITENISKSINERF